MLHAFLKIGLRLNRTIGFTFWFYALVMGVWGIHHWTDWLRLNVFVILTTFCMLLNEGALRLIKRFPQSDPLFLEKFSILSPIAALVTTLVGYLLSGELGAGLLMILPVLQAQFYGHARLAGALFTLLLGVFALTTVWPFARSMGPEPLQSVISWLPLLVALLQFGNAVGKTVRASTSQLSRLQNLAATDGLTGLINRRQFNHQLQSEIARARRHQAPLSLALFDIDDFKKLNDVYGHPVGDRILKELGGLIIHNVRECDISARYGGEEFALILPETRLVEAYEILERLRGLVERTVFCLPDNPITFTISVGVAQLDPDHPTAFELVEKADACLYEAKKKGKNRVIYGVIPTPKVNLSTPPGSRPRSPR
jgi:diguanylate cyclase (GGDEF)-like protein